MGLQNKAGWIEAAVATLVAIAGVVFWAGENSRGVADAETRLTKVEHLQNKDHDTVVGMSAKLDALQGDVTDIKSDVKTLVAQKKNK